MFCIKCGMMLDNSAKSCPACGTKMVFPEGFTPDDSPSPAPKAEVILSNEPPHAPDDFDLSKANITYNGKTMLINDEPEIDLDMTMAAPVPRAPQAAPAQPVYQQPVYTAPSSYIPSPVPTAQEEETVEDEAPKSKSKLPVIIGISVAVLIVAIVAIVMIMSKGGDKKEAKAPDAPTVSSVGKTENASVTIPNLDADAEDEVILAVHSNAPADNLVYIVREKDMASTVIAQAKIGYLEDDTLAADFAASNEKEAKEFVPFEKIEELKEALENGDINVILASEEFSGDIISKKDGDGGIEFADPDRQDDEEHEPLAGVTEPDSSDNSSEDEGADETTTKPAETAPALTTDAETTTSGKPPVIPEEN